ncbi:MAG: HDOD domain-containing protein [Gammaproteobacteria bacterium]|nr:HDOD domain-containing protein [Gammaproteobacteria bacterium]
MQTKTSESNSAQAFTFVQALAGELNGGTLELPSFPDAVMKITKALDDQDVDMNKLAALVGSEPALSARLMKVANSAMMHRGTRPVTELRSAINRLGLDMVRNAAMSVAMEQLLLAKEHADIRNLMGQLWHHSVKVAAIAYTLAAQHENLNADEAMLGGLVHDIGKLYIWTRAKNFPEFLSDAQTLSDVTHEWHPVIGKAILENWGFQSQLLEAAEGHESLDDHGFGPPDLTSVVAVANYLSKLPAGVVPDDSDLFETAAFKRLAVTPDNCEQLLAAAEENSKSLGAAMNP